MTLIWAHQPTEAYRVERWVDDSRMIVGIIETGARTRAQCEAIIRSGAYRELPRYERIHWVINNDWHPQRLRLERVP